LLLQVYHLNRPHNLFLFSMYTFRHRRIRGTNLLQKCG
jgi:hypothetical protein